MPVKVYVDSQAYFGGIVEMKTGKRPRRKWLPRWLSWLPGYWIRFDYSVISLPEPVPAGQDVVLRYEIESPFAAERAETLTEREQREREYIAARCPALVRDEARR